MCSYNKADWMELAQMAEVNYSATNNGYKTVIAFISLGERGELAAALAF